VREKFFRLMTRRASAVGVNHDLHMISLLM